MLMRDMLQYENQRFQVQRHRFLYEPYSRLFQDHVSGRGREGPGVDNRPDLLGNVLYSLALILPVHVEMQRPGRRSDHTNAITFTQLIQVLPVLLKRRVTVFQNRRP